MNNRLVIAVVAATLVAAAGGFGLYRLGMTHGMAMAPSSAAGPAAATAAEGEEATRRHIASGLKAGDMDPLAGRRILYYHDPMVPGNRFDRPAKSPFMDMMLVPVYAGAEGDEGKVTISPRIQQNLGLRTAEVVQGTLSLQVSCLLYTSPSPRD